MTRHKQRKGFKPRSLYQWHRYLGLSAGILVVILALTGILLNHTEDFSLDARFVENNALLDWYGIKADAPTSYRAGAHWISLSDGRVYLDAQPTVFRGTALHGAVADDAGLGILLDDGLLILNPQGELVERLDQTAGLPSAPVALGSTPQGRWVVRAGGTAVEVDPESGQWLPLTDIADVAWSTVQHPPEALDQQLRDRARHRTLPWERVVLDLHSGRLFGPIGVWVMDAAAVVMLLLAASGTWLWWWQRRKLRKP